MPGKPHISHQPSLANSVVKVSPSVSICKHFLRAPDLLDLLLNNIVHLLVVHRGSITFHVVELKSNELQKINHFFQDIPMTVDIFKIILFKPLLLIRYLVFQSRNMTNRHKERLPEKPREYDNRTIRLLNPKKVTVLRLNCKEVTP